jgi:hypothetical protein
LRANQKRQAALAPKLKRRKQIRLWLEILAPVAVGFTVWLLTSMR